MTSARHRGPDRRSGPRSRVWVSALLIVGVVLGSFVAGQSLATAEDPRTARFTGVVTQFADEGALMCVRREGTEGSNPFCDLYYVRPGTPPISVGDRVSVTTITSRNGSGAPMSGMLVAPLP